VQISAHSILHNFTPGAWQGIRQALSAEQLEVLGVLSPGGTTPPETPPITGGLPAPPYPPGPPSGGGLSRQTPSAAAVLLPEDEPLLAELGRDGRTSHAALATALHWHESTVRRRIEELRRSGLLHFEVDVDSRCLGMNVSALLWLKVEPSRLDAVGQALAPPARPTWW